MRSVAVVGMSCRFPNGIENTDQLWWALQNRVNTASPVPADRWDVQRYFAADESAKGKAYIRNGNFLSQDIRTFDAAFFDIPPRVAENMDPQQRILLEVVWEAFENAGLDLTEHAGKRVGVYVGGFMLDHMITQMVPANRAQINQNTAAGMTMTMLSNRISHAFDLRGPSLSIDTACSSSLVAFNYACRDIWNGTCDLAVVAGANIMTRPEFPIGMCKGQFLSRDGQCKSFDARGDGYGRGEGAAAVLLKAGDLAQADGDRILATVVGTGANSDGRTPGISMPSAEAQEALIREVCAGFAIDPSDVRYVECHGTGTAVGDPIEARSVGRVYGAGKTGPDRVVIGSIKSNIGHLEAVAGVAGIIKAVLTLQHRQATPLANLQTPNPDIPFAELGVRLADDHIVFVDTGRPLLAAVNSFGYGGTNAHAVLAAAPAVQTAAVAPVPDTPAQATAFPHALPVSARSPSALKALAERLASQLNGEQHVPLADVLFSASHRRAHLAQRAVVWGASRSELVEGLQALAQGAATDRVCVGSQPYTGQRKPVFVFTGMGPQWWSMGQALYRQDAVYRQAVDDADAAFQTVAGFSILAEMLKDEASSQIEKTIYAQPANFLLQVGLVAVLKAGGVEPGAIVGHSVGEVAAAYFSGVLSLKDALRVSYHRSRLQATTAGNGSMLAVGLSEAEAQAWISSMDGQVDIAAVNGPATVTLAGVTSAVKLLAERLTDAQVFNRLLQVEVAYHSHLMDPILDELQAALCALSPHSPHTPVYSTVSGERVQTAPAPGAAEHVLEADAFGGAYWPRNVREPVAFMKAVGALIEDGFNTFVEVGPHPVLSSALRDVAKAMGKDIRLVETLRRTEADECVRLWRSVGMVFAQGCAIDWSALCAPAQLATLPNYPWQRERLWLESERGVVERVGPTDLPVLGMQEVPASLAWRNDLEHEPLRYLKEHVVAGNPLMPAAGYLEALFELAGWLHPQSPVHVLRHVQIAAPLMIGAERAVDLVTSFDPATRRASIRSVENGRVGEGQLHVTGEIGLLGEADDTGVVSVDLQALAQRIATEEDVTGFYASLNRIGLSYGPYFQTVRLLAIDRVAGEVLARIELDERLAAQLPHYRAHPTLLDGCFQALIGMLDVSGATFLPTGFAELRLRQALPATFWCHAVRVQQTAQQVDCDITLIDDTGEVLGVVRGMRAVAVPGRIGRVDQYGDAVKRQILAYQWNVGARLSEPRRLGHWLVVEDNAAGVGTEVIQRIESFGARVQARARLGDAFSLLGECATLRLGHDADVQALLQHAGPLDGIAFLHGLDATATSDDPVAMAAIDLMVAFTKGLLHLPVDRRPRLYAVTRAAFEVEEYDAPVQPGQTAINGFARVAFNEVEGVRFTSVDLPGETSAEHLDALTLELLCDAPEDEVALRRQSRFFSELQETRVLEPARIAIAPLQAEQPVQVRGMRDTDEGSGTVKLMEAVRTPVQADGLELRIEAMGLPFSTLIDPEADTLAQPFVEVVGTVMAVGAAVADLQPGDRVCGLAPAEVASHIHAPRGQFHLVSVPEGVEPRLLIGSLGLHACAERAVELADVEAATRALVFDDAMGRAVAAALQRSGARITWVVPVGGSSPDGAPHIEATVDAVEAACGAHASAAFDVVAAPLSFWTDRFGLRCLREGGTLIDTDAQAQPLNAPAHVGNTVRCDVRGLAQRPARLAEALARAVGLLASGAVAGADQLAVSATDLAWQRIEIPMAQVGVVLTFELDGRDVPIYQRDRVAFHPDASYLVTGGLGGFGQKTAQWLADHGARHLVLVGRSGADTDERRAFVHDLQARGVSVSCPACDSSNTEQMRVLLAQIATQGPPLRGVFHSAAVIQDQAIADMDRETFQRVMRNKAVGAWVLHQLTADLPLDHFVLYSSVANTVGNSRQAAYVAANGFLDGLAWHRRAHGLAATSVNWGAISDVGVVTRDEKLEQFLRYIGLRGISSAEGLDLLGSALLREVTQFGVTLITNWGDWARYETLGGKSPRFATLIAADSHPADAAVRERLRAELADLSAGDRFAVLSGLIAEVIAGELQCPAESIAVDRPVKELGVDSLMATEIQLVLERDLGLSVSVLELLGDTTIRGMTDKALLGLALGDAAGEPAAVVPMPA